MPAHASPQRITRTLFKGNPTIRNRIAKDGIYAAVMASPPTITPGGTSTALTGGNRSRSPLELRSSYSPIFQPASRTDYEAVLAYSYAGDTTLVPRQRGSRIVTYEFDVTGQQWEFAINNPTPAGAIYWLWVNEQPVTADPVNPAGTNNTQHFLVDHGAAAPAGQPYRIMLMLSAPNVGLLYIKHKNADQLWSPSLQAHGQIIWIGDSIGEGSWADVQTTTRNVQYQHGNFLNQLAWKLGLWDMVGWTAISGRGVLKTAANGSGPYLGTVQNDLSLVVRRPSGEGTCIVFQSSTNDIGSYTAAQVQAAAIIAINTAKAAYPDALILGVGCLAAPRNSIGDPTTYDAAWQAAITATVGADNWIDTTDIFQGTGNETTPASDGNCDTFALADENASFSGKAPPHPNSKGHKHIANKLAPKFASRLGISLATDDNWTVTAG